MSHCQQDLQVCQNFFFDDCFFDNIPTIFYLSDCFIEDAKNLNKQLTLFVRVLLRSLALTGNFVQLLHQEMQPILL